MNGISGLVKSDYVIQSSKLNQTKSLAFKNVNNPQNVDSVNLSEKKAKRKKIATGIAIGAAVVAATALVVYKIKQGKISKNTPEELKPLFESLKNKDGADFVDSAYDGIKKYMHLEDVAPKKVILNAKADGAFNAITGGYNFIDNSISYSKGFTTKLSKKQQFNLLSHELKHCKQHFEILATEGLGKKSIAEAYAEHALNSKNLFGKVPVEEIKKGLSKEEAQKLIAEEKTKLVNEVLEKIKVNHPDLTQTLKKISPDSPEGINAKKYLDAIKNYEGLDMLGLGSDKYRQNFLEVEAYDFGNKMGQQFSSCQSIKSKVLDFIKILKNVK